MATNPERYKSGDVGVIRAHLSAMQAEGDMFAALDDAELDYLCI